MESPPLVIRWLETESLREHWFIRGLRADGSFYRDKVRYNMVFTRRETRTVLLVLARSIEGKLFADQIARVSKLAAQYFANDGCTDTDMPLIGVLADGPVS